jgi:6-phosphogluconolactonase
VNVIRTKNFVADATKFIVDLAQDSLGARNQFRIALSGGNTPRPVYSAFARENIPWELVEFTFGDERCVPPVDEQSNYRMARESLFEPGNVPEESVLRMRGEIEPRQAADEYEQELAPDYRHDLILLGMGEDGHTASLFPGTAALKETKRSVVANFVPKFDQWRITFTFPFINSARHVCFLVNAKKNRELIEKVLAGDEQYPSAHVGPRDGTLTWILGE